ncbi:hypothetical protein BT63DRAFT_460593 [Microthyrium microscopicum]|uniref:Uncharacterized protein n=1 Tax=Microthyrium microscopicum TaxID=703497 RepID=A0A6A6TZJ8_9PEZI|nr:hypothetical protein BT63DRAFT_460593 [Microthyrium microscopicum]
MPDSITSDWSSTSESETEPKRFDSEQCILALQGKSLPLDSPVAASDTRAQLAIVRGIRYHYSFARSSQINKLCRDGAFPQFVRACNARFIMSNIIPEIDQSEHFPYCIWHPEFASERTYRTLAQRYPNMRYSVGRACAAAGYVDLYRELGLLPDVSIAEEAREGTENGHIIFEDIISQTVRYSIMDDYTRSINIENPRAGAFLNGDTAVRKSLDQKRRLDNWSGHYFDITEDRCVDEEGYKWSFEQTWNLESQHVPLLYNPLPLDLPTVNKDLLILMAAYDGNVDRYARLRRPESMQLETFCVIRGIYHSTMFAKWWFQERKRSLKGRGDIGDIEAAINARFIMDNDISSITDETPDYVLPYLIWYPAWPQQTTLQELAHRRPSMKQQIAHACIVADYQSTYDSLDVVPHNVLLQEAQLSHNKHYAEDLKRRAAAMDIDLTKVGNFVQRLNENTVIRDKEPTTTWLQGSISAGHLDQIFDEGIYGCRGIQVNANMIKLFVCASEELREKASNWEGGWMGLYKGDVNFGNLQEGEHSS